ncbi:N,N-dimethylformamidase beta subunit family domain-containing protein [Mesorhizobium sp. INR15]|uniref:N,N-dimethylformamidase beta subunit family domain-containing protein n=1 Tax=Mesorhizobium sp. INR15 TaxID=2654248 RepID=UPI00189663D0|nr:N,N-dimethylformamidase beta subunit family domain-containing protein [Mesorhizobium sp. INR15]QPC94516.1 N,N-dimethylformamidase [Mesorhizobium sp. INR15]
MLKITGYADRVSAVPGSIIRFMINCEYPNYRASVVRVVQGDTAAEAPPVKLVPVPSAIDGRYPGRHQVIHAGSFGRIDCNDIFSNSPSLSLQAMIMPTTPIKSRQAIISKWDEVAGRGIAMVIAPDGSIGIEISDGITHKLVSVGKPMLAKHWYFAAVTYDTESGRACVYQEPQHQFPTIDDGGSASSVLPSGIAWENSAPLLFAASWGGEDAGRMVGRALYNGKIDRPRISVANLPLADLQALRGDRWAERLSGTLAGAWDFSRDISGIRIDDVSGRGRDGVVVNMPTRGVTGHNFTGEDGLCWKQKPEQWSAIHFHDDDVYDAGWLADFSLTIPENMKSGIYAVRIEAEGEEQFVTFVVRPARGKPTSKLAFLFPLATYMAYANEHFGTNDGLVELHLNRALVLHPHQQFLNEHREYGHSLYDLHSDGSGVYYSSRLRPVLNLRPKVEANHGAGPSHLWLFNADTHITSWLENFEQEYDVITDEDLHEEGCELLSGYRTVVTATHPEYYSKEMWDGVQRFTNSGGRLIYLGGNGFYWRIAYHSTQPGIIEVRRAEGGSRAWEPPTGEYYHSFTGEYGGLWRRQGNRSPNHLVGVGFTAQGFDQSSPYRRAAGASDPRAAFIMAGIDDEILGDFGLTGGGAAGMELDRHDVSIGSPPHSLVVASSGHHTEAHVFVVEDMLFNFMGSTGDVCDKVRADLVFFETPNGGAVFSVGSIAYSGSLPWNNFDNNISRLTLNVLRRFMDPAPFPMPAT